MRRITGSNTIELSPGKLGFRDRNTGAGVPGTQLLAQWTNDVQEELLAPIEAVGLAPAADRNQLLTAIRALLVPYAADTGAQNTLTINVDRPGWSLAAGQAVKVKVLNSVIDDATVHILNGAADLGTYPLIRPDGTALCPYDLVAGQIVDLVYDGASLQVSRVEGRTGDMLLALAGTSRAAHVPLNGLTIGPAGSGASGRAHADTRKLYTYLYYGFPDTICPVTSGRGLNAATDWDIGKPIKLPDTRCRMPIGVDGMGGAALLGLLAGVAFGAGSASVPGAFGGAALHTLIESELAVHDHPITDPGHNHQKGHGADLLQDESSGTIRGHLLHNPDDTVTTTATTGITVNDAGGGQPHNNMPPFVTVVMFARL